MLILSILYALILVILSVGLSRLPKPLSSLQPRLSVVVAARNEEKNIPLLLQALAAQNYPRKRFEIIIADDGSSDGTAGEISRFGALHPDLDLRSITVVGREQVASPKKNALQQAIAHATGEVLVFTDADCQPGPRWLSSLIRYFAPGIEMVIGFSPMEKPSLASLGHRLLALDALSLAALSAGSTGWRAPATCNGRNLAYRKNLYDRIGGYTGIDQFVSGDDDLFLSQAIRFGHTHFAYALDAEAVVPTRLLQNWHSFFHQRLRHASKGFHYSAKKIGLLVMTYLYNVLMAVMLVKAFFGHAAAIEPLAVLLIKSAGELALLIPFSHQMRRLRCLAVFPVAAILHPFYVVIFGALGQFWHFNWKEERFAKQNRAKTGVSI
ncbi:MAG TPA: glycosyltransferase [bacterium]|nr:glycosyltransferase [bacterium]HPG45139.1 glycosyltransferase [bacterium]HPM97381.1 glycosyltransferase [bacterium]